MAALQPTSAMLGLWLASLAFGSVSMQTPKLSSSRRQSRAMSMYRASKILSGSTPPGNSTVDSGTAAGASGRAFDRAMAHDDRTVLAKAACQFLDDVHRAMAAAGAADGHRQVVAVGPRHSWAATCRESAADVVQHLAGLWHLLQVGHHRGIAARQRPQQRVVMGVGQVAHIEDEVAATGTPCLNANDSNASTRSAGGTSVNWRTHCAACSVQLAGVDHVAGR